MPVERQSRAALTGRDRKLIAMLAALAVAGAITAGINERGTSASHSTTNCVAVDLPSTVGGAHLIRCGRAAAELCKSQSSADSRIATACRQHGYQTR